MISPRLSKGHRRAASVSVSPRPTVDTSKISRTWTLKIKGDPPADKTTHKSAEQSPALLSPPYNYLTLNMADFGSPIVTQQIAELNDIHVPAPIVMDNAALKSTSSAESPASSTICGHGQPMDDHKTRPVPRPSRFPAPLPMKVDSEVGEGRQTRAAAIKSPKVPASDDMAVQGQTNMFTHRREAATAIKEQDSTLSDKPALTLEEITPSSQSDVPISPQYRILPPTPLAKPPASSNPKDASPPKLDHTKFDRWVKDNPQFTTRDLRRGASLDESRRYGLDRSRSPLSSEHLNVEPPEPPLKSLRHSITTKVKRFSSISRATSLSTNRSSQETRRSSRTPSPLPSYQARTPPLNSQKIISMNPAALFCHEIGGQNTTLQRCYIYANKINELSMHDCGLSNWIVQMKDQSLVPQRRRGPSSRLYVPQPRHTSRSSVISEATFPRRLDATTATDLSPGQFDDVAPPGLPQLPYPSLALRTVPARSNTSSSSTSPPTSLRSLTPSFSTSGFFAALGRKASLSKKDRPQVLSTRITSPGVVPNGARLPHGKISQPTINPRPIQITMPPTIPGGPRAPPSRSKRSQTFQIPVTPASAAASGRDDLPARPPFSNDTATLDSVIEINQDPEFTKQVDKLAALIPQANRDILAGYLRRAGSDMQAIGQYLEDERTGVVRSH